VKLKVGDCSLIVFRELEWNADDTDGLVVRC